MKIKIEIGTLVLEGFEYHDRLRISRAIEKELYRQLSEKGVPESFAQKTTMLNVDASPFHLPPDANPTRVGIEAARSILKAVNKKGA